MTSKEALMDLRIHNHRFYEKSKGEYADNKPLYEIIGKDLEVLEILKKHIELTPYRTISGFRDAGLTDDEYNKVKEWLENV